MIYELRIYHCMPGKLSELTRRLEKETLPLWKKHGIEQAGFWTVAVGGSNQDLYYMLKWKSLADRETKWSQFLKDPEWIRQRDESEKTGLLIASVSNMILQPTSFSAVK
jgi:hypothetical protein